MKKMCMTAVIVAALFLQTGFNLNAATTLGVGDVVILAFN